MASRRLRRVGLLTGGGDCPGLNAVIRAAARTGFQLGWEVWGIEDGSASAREGSSPSWWSRKGRSRATGGRSCASRRRSAGSRGWGGIGEWLAVEIARHTGKETRNLVLGHLRRGGQPPSFDRLLGTRFGAAAMCLVAEGRFRTRVALDPPKGPRRAPGQSGRPR